MDIKLTQYTKGGGCGCKLAPIALSEILASHQVGKEVSQLLVGNDSRDDAAVYQIDEKNAIISTTDFFMPIVDDAFSFGEIAAANAISDVYAMGGKPIFALAVLGWPLATLPASVAAQVMEGARKTCAKAGIVIAGGHSIESQDPIFGLVVNGIVPVQNLKRNDTAKEGDVLILTKPIGVGILATAQKKELISEQDLTKLLNQLTTINQVGEQLGKIEGVHAMTDVTGFGLLGHLHEMMEGSALQACISYEKIPILEEARTYIAQKAIPDATSRNWNAYSKEVKFETGVNVMEAFQLLPDPQTNGGLLIAVSPDAVQKVQSILKEAGIELVEPIGYCTTNQDKRIVIQK
ncbi:MAG: selenide, water dikinase SelD [Chitinophagaceae bacterium]|jgi:selenide,water dikinase|nr:selenide, water dikinase SelD [Sediminibacterium sp.]